MKGSFKVIPESVLGVSEPPPEWFGNGSNERNNPKWTNGNWLKSRFHFSFAEYSNPHNMGYGVLRVMNDDLVQPSRGFGTHPHRDVEICTYIVSGSLTHQDSMGSAETITRGAIQFMTAGTGVSHSEHNLDPNNDLRFIQIWINTRKRGLRPNYGSTAGDAKSRLNRFDHLVSDAQDATSSTPIRINQDANIYVAEIEKSNGPVPFEVKDGRQCYILCIEGGLAVNENSYKLNKHDAAEVAGPISLTIQPQVDCNKVHCLIVEMKFDGSGRTDVKVS